MVDETLSPDTELVIVPVRRFDEGSLTVSMAGDPDHAWQQAA
ncbi:MAG: hypothetical protein ACRDTF_12850 [Pseudonocardiaceae bacterium]